jgi:hypothetical protein
MKSTSHSLDITNPFLYRAERQRLDAECLRPLDLRPHTSSLCKRFFYRGRPLWLDSVGRQLFLDGLEQNAGVFTVETYESILKRFIGVATDSGLAFQNKNISHCHTTCDVQISDTFESNSTIEHSTIDLSYFERRTHDRLKISLNIGLILNGITYAAETRDISQTGMQLRIRMPIEVCENDTVQVDVSLTASRQLKHPVLDYRVVRIRRLLNYTLLALQEIENEGKDGMLVISDHITDSSQTVPGEQAVPEDALLTAQALLAERFYMRSTGILPFFVFESLHNESPVRIIFGNQVNERSLAAFRNTEGSYDFRSLVTHKRIKLLVRLALRDSKADTLFAVYRTPGQSTPQVTADLECRNHKHWRRLLARHKEQPGFRVFKVVARLAHRPVKMRINDTLEPFSNQGKEFEHVLLMDSKNLTIVGALIDVTEQFQSWLKSGCEFDESTHEKSNICCEKEPLLSPPQLVPIHYIQENRFENRYVGQVHVEIDFNGQIHPGVTQDVSGHGLSVNIERRHLASMSERQVAITFPKLASNSSKLSKLQGVFEDVPAELVSGPAEGKQLFHFKICDNTKGRLFTRAFSDILKRRQPALTLENSHTSLAATSRLYSSIFIESSATLPVFIFQKSQTDWIYRLGTTVYPIPLLDYLEIADGKHDFSFLGAGNRLQRLLLQMPDDGPSELFIYLCKQRHENAPSFTISSVADFEFNDEASRRAFVQHAMDHDFRCVKVVLNKPSVPPKAEIDQAIYRLTKLSSSRSERLRADFGNLVAIGDVVDITGLVSDTLFEHPAHNVMDAILTEEGDVLQVS